MITGNFSKTLNLMTGALAVLLMTANIGCSKDSGSGDSGASAAAVTNTISMSGVPTTVAPGGTVYLTPTGGSGTYTFNLVNSIGGTLSQPTGASSIYTAPTTGGQTQQISIVDSAGQSVFFPITITGTSTGGTISVSPLNGTVVPGGALPFTVSGGTAPYNYSVISGGGYFSANTYYAPTTAQTVTVRIGDSAGASVQTNISVTGSGTGTGTVPNCGGTYSLTVSGVTGTLSIVEDTSGSIAGLITLPTYDQYGNYLGPQSAGITGSCSYTGAQGVMNFTNSFSHSVYSGTIYMNANTNKLAIFGNFVTTDRSSYSWSATQQ